MKKMLVMLLAVFSAVWVLAAEKAAPAAAPAKQAAAEVENWNLFEIGFLPGAPSDMLTVPVYGLKLGAPICHGAPVWGVEASVLYSGSDDVKGFQGSLIYCQAENMTGLQLSIINFVKSCAGLQLGVFNSAKDQSFQIGILNHIENGWIPWTLVLNCKF